MKKNVASQIVGAQMTTAADGTDFTGTVTCYYTIDGGTQTIGSVGSGICTHEGKGYHTYAPAQAETNGDLVSFSFSGTGAVTASVHIYTSFPQTVDNNVLAAGATGFAAIDTVVDAILVDTNDLQTNQGNWATATGFALASVCTEGRLAELDAANLPADVDGIQTDLSNGTDGLGALKILVDAVNTDLSNGTDGLGALKAIMDTSGVLVATGGLSAASLATDAVNEIRDGIFQGTLTEGYAADGAAATLQQMLYMIWSGLAEFAISGTTITCKKLDGTTTSMTFTLDDGTDPTSRTRAT